MRYPKWARFIFFFAVAFSITGCMLYRLYYDQELSLVRKRFEALPGVRVLKIRGYEDELGLEYWEALTSGKDVPNPKERLFKRVDKVSATVHIEGFGRIDFADVTRLDFESADVIRIGDAFNRQEKVDIGSHSVFTYGEGFTLGKRGMYSPLFPRNYRNLPDLISNVDEVRLTMSRWPVCPKDGRFEGGEGYVHYYCIDAAGG
jgi:hypothetical protein